MKRILVTGDTGFVGTYLVAELLRKKQKVIGLSRTHQKEGLGYEAIDHDLTKQGTPNIKDVDVVVHLAADTGCKDNQHADSINVEGTKKMLELAKKLKIKCFVYASTGGVYGYGNKPFVETTNPSPHNHYTETKYRAEALCELYSAYFPVVVLRYFFPYGKWHDEKRLVNRLINKIKRGRVVELNVGGKPTINPVAVEDAVDITIKAMKPASRFEIFNVGGNEEISVLQLVRTIEKQLKVEANIKYNNEEVWDMIGSITKMKKVLGFEPKISLEKGIKNMIK